MHLTLRNCPGSINLIKSLRQFIQRDMIAKTDMPCLLFFPEPYIDKLHFLLHKVAAALRA